MTTIQTQLMGALTLVSLIKDITAQALLQLVITSVGMDCFILMKLVMTIIQTLLTDAIRVLKLQDIHAHEQLF